MQLEKVAAQRPDLILGVYSGLKKRDYEKLSKLAPVVAQPQGPARLGQLVAGGDADDRARRSASPARGASSSPGTQRLLADTAAEHPGSRARRRRSSPDYQGVFVYGKHDVRTRLLEELGFEFPRELA